MSVWRRSAAVALAVGLTLGTAALSRMPVRFAHTGTAMLRLSWKINGVTVEACRERSPEELAALIRAAHEKLTQSRGRQIVCAVRSSAAEWPVPRTR